MDPTYCLPGLVNIQKNYGTSPFSMGKSTISMAIFNSELSVITRGYGVQMWPWNIQYLSAWWLQTLRKMMEFVSWDDDIPN